MISVTRHDCAAQVRYNAPRFPGLFVKAGDLESRERGYSLAVEDHSGDEWCHYRASVIVSYLGPVTVWPSHLFKPCCRCSTSDGVLDECVPMCRHPLITAVPGPC